MHSAAETDWVCMEQHAWVLAPTRPSVVTTHLPYDRRPFLSLVSAGIDKSLGEYFPPVRMDETGELYSTGV